MSLGTFSIKISDYIDTELSAVYKTLFNEYVINPTEDNLSIVKQALELLNGNSFVDPLCKELSFFSNTWLVKVDDVESKKDLMTYVLQLNEKITNRISRLKQIKEDHEKQLANDWEVINEQKPLFLETIRRGLAEPNIEIRKETVKEANKYFSLSLHRLPSEQLLYDAICDDDVADFYFLRCQGEFLRKSDFIIQCIKHNNFNRAERLVSRIIKTASYEDFYEMTDNAGHWKGYSWEWDAKNIIGGVIREMNREINCPYASPPNDEEIREVKKLALMVFPYLKKSAFQAISSEFAMLCFDETDIKSTYISNLCDDLVYYTQNSSRRKNGDVGSINSISEEIFGSFCVLDKMWEPEILAKVLKSLCESNSAPVRYSNFMTKCISSVSDEMVIFLLEHHSELIQKWLSDHPIKSSVDELLKKIRSSQNESLITMCSSMIDEAMGT